MISGVEGLHDFNVKDLATSLVEPVTALMAKFCSSTSLRDSTKSTCSPFGNLKLAAIKPNRAVSLGHRFAI